MEGLAAATGLTAVTTAMADIPTYMTSVWDVMTSNPYTVTFLGAGLIYLGIRIFRSVKRAAMR